MTPAADAIVVYQDQFRAAVLVFRLDDGVAWVEPGYLTGDGSGSPCFHRVRCTVTDYARGMELTTENGFGLIIDRAQVPDGDELDRPELRADFEAYEQALKEKGLTREGEAKKLTELLAYDLA